MRIIGAELSADARRLQVGGRHYVLRYWLVQERLADGAETYYVRCWQRELVGRRSTVGEVEVAGLGGDVQVARSIYDRLVAGKALPIHLPELVEDARREMDARMGCRPVGRSQSAADQRTHLAAAAR
jgi:hypothetical protein